MSRALFFLDALVELVAHVPEAIVAARRGRRHDRAEMPDDVVEVVQERAVLGERQPVMDHRVHLAASSLELAPRSASVISTSVMKNDGLTAWIDG